MLCGQDRRVKRDIIQKVNIHSTPVLPQRMKVVAAYRRCMYASLYGHPLRGADFQSIRPKRKHLVLYSNTYLRVLNNYSFSKMFRAVSPPLWFFDHICAKLNQLSYLNAKEFWLFSTSGLRCRIITKHSHIFNCLAYLKSFVHRLPGGYGRHIDHGIHIEHGRHSKR